MTEIKKDFIVRRTITEIEGKPHVETYSEQELVRCKNCRHRDPEDRKCDCGGMPWNTQILPVPDDWFCPNGEKSEHDVIIMSSQTLTFTSDELFYIQEMMREARANPIKPGDYQDEKIEKLINRIRDALDESYESK